MENVEEEEDVKLVKASGTLLTDFEAALPKLLWKPCKAGDGHGRVHSRVKKQDLEYLIGLIEPFQSEPQLLDAKLKDVLPSVVDALLEYLQLGRTSIPEEVLDFESGVSSILYTLCKVRGYKVVVGFFNNEPKHFDLILSALERVVFGGIVHQATWQVQYILLLWVSHLLLTPFDLASISDRAAPRDEGLDDGLQLDLPPLATRILRVAQKLLPSSTKAQDGAAAVLGRLVNRPDMQRLRLADVIVTQALGKLQNDGSDLLVTAYEHLGPLRLLAGITSSADLAHLIPEVYHACQRLSTQDASSTTLSNAVAKKIMVKILRNIVILSLRSVSAGGSLASSQESTNVVEDVMDYLLRSLGDRDTPVRYAAAKAISLVVLELEPAMAHEVIQAVLDMFMEDTPRNSAGHDFGTVNPLKWHGLTLALAHTLFKRSAAPEQLPDVLHTLTAALQFEQRTATGSSIGTNVRDAANFGIWSLSRRYTTKELLSIDAKGLHTTLLTEHTTVIQLVALKLIISACLDPSGNIRRGSSAALQELIGRHPDQVYGGISLVQIVNYQAVGLRRRAMVDVAGKAAALHPMYWNALLEALLQWRGIRSTDVPSREAAADSLANLNVNSHDPAPRTVMQMVVEKIRTCQPSDAESLHGLILTLACIVERHTNHCLPPARAMQRFWKDVLDVLQLAMKDFHARTLRSELPAAAGRVVAAFCRAHLEETEHLVQELDVLFASIDWVVERLMTRQEDTILTIIPPLVQTLLSLKRKIGTPLGCIGAQTLCKRVAMDGSKSTLSGAGRAVALGALTCSYGSGVKDEQATAAISTLAGLVDSMTVDWRVIGIRAVQLAIENVRDDHFLSLEIASLITNAVHRGMSDYTIDERGDVGSLVRLQAVSCTFAILARKDTFRDQEILLGLQADIFRLSLEKLDRVRLEAARCRSEYFDLDLSITDITSVSSYEYFSSAQEPLRENGDSALTYTAVLEGCISCAGVSAGTLLQVARAALIDILNDLQIEHLALLMSLYSKIMNAMLSEASNMHPVLELLAFLLDMQIPQRRAAEDFKWRNLLSYVQKSHHKSNEIPRILAAVHVYGGLAGVPVIRAEVVKRLLSMLRTNPYPKVRITVAETLLLITKHESLKSRDWIKPPAQNTDLVVQLEKECA